MLVLLDTCVLVDAERGGAALEELVHDDDEPAIAAITVAELRVGVAIARGRRKERRRAFVDDLVALVPVLSYDLAVAEAHGALLVAAREAGRPRGAHDLIIAATARAAGRTVVTGDAAGFDALPGVTVRRPAAPG